MLIAAVSMIVLIFYFFNSSFSISNLISQNGPAPIGFNQFSTSNLEFESQKFHLVWFPQMFLIVCSIFTSLAFMEYAESKNINFHLPIPATKFEKWLSKAFIILLLLPLGYLVAYQLFAILTYSWDNNLSSEQVHLTLGDPYLWGYASKVLLLQCIIFLGATIFKKYAFFKITLTIFLIYVAYNLLQFLTFQIVNEDLNLLSANSTPGITPINASLRDAGYYISSPHLQTISDLYTNDRFHGIFCVLALGALFLSYQRFKEMES